VTQDVLDQEREIFAHQARESGKPENIIDKIVDGKMSKFYEENCLLDQTFIKDGDVTIQELIKQKIAKLGENITVGEFTRFEISK
jgi:elongation factor Ts